MNNTLVATFPLQDNGIHNLRQLGQCIWDWQICDICEGGGTTCTNANCSWSRAERLQNFWTRYTEITSAYVPVWYTRPALGSHDALIEIIRSIRDNQGLERKDLLQKIFVDGVADEARRPDARDQNRALNIAASILLITSCGTPHDCPRVFEDDRHPVSWRESFNTAQFVAEAYRENNHPYFDLAGDRYNESAVVAGLHATKLARLGFKFEATDDLRSHLLLVHERRTIRIFHMSAVLKETLSMASGNAKLSILPRAVALEAYRTIHDILFPPGTKSHSLLSSLVSKHGFDEDMLHYESVAPPNGEVIETSYNYFGHRLAEIYDEVQDPSPHGRVERWLERKKGTRYMLLATMIGVFIAVVLGFLGLGAAIFQAWVGYQQLQYSKKGM